MTHEPVQHSATSTPRQPLAAPNVHPRSATAGRLPRDYLSASRIHVALTLDQLLAVGHEPVIGCWPSLLMVTSSASLQLDPANGLSSAQAMRITGGLLLEVTRWHESIRRHGPIAQDSAEADFMLKAEGG